MVPDLPISAPGVNSVVIHDDYIEIIWDGAQNVDKVRQTNLEAAKGAEILKSKGKPVLGSLLIRNHPLTPNIAAFQEVLKMFRATSPNRVVICGTVSPMIMTLVATVTSSFNREIEIAYIADPDAALSWLRSPKK